ncbi:hypothetical protein, partial [Novosphingobium sp. PC22D]|uniref:hypothetical protein n=1 Tax=Novosphingobium sp. PC22D TaxID=1962403 RepID=UPI00197DA424
PCDFDYLDFDKTHAFLRASAFFTGDERGGMHPDLHLTGAWRAGIEVLDGKVFELRGVPEAHSFHGNSLISAIARFGSRTGGN